MMVTLPGEVATPPTSKSCMTRCLIAPTVLGKLASGRLRMGERSGPVGLVAIVTLMAAVAVAEHPPVVAVTDRAVAEVMLVSTIGLVVSPLLQRKALAEAMVASKSLASLRLRPI